MKQNKQQSVLVILISYIFFQSLTINFLMELSIVSDFCQLIAIDKKISVSIADIDQ